ncbi:hypothetical protein IQ62_04565 [Streptomyces scabiei]|uniref:hypothetical protein n=1 Tax=Streptomyces scabiei TaxID=1930 RepID=UPI0004E7BA18|nr:hypothetical protein [Streptomyces scabiei]KFG01977.1 hypothetical protein IQ62_04565 [Streptomyces scabiei]
MRAVVRVGSAGPVVLLAVLLGGCGGVQGPSPDVGRSAVARGPSDGPSTAAGVDGEIDPQRGFTEGELKAALLPGEAFGRGARVIATDLGLFGRSGGGDWTSCADGDDLRVEMRGVEGDSAQRTVRLGGASEDGPVVTVQFVSLPGGRAERYLEIRRLLNETCPDVTVDTDAAPVQEHHEAREVDALGDETLSESTRRTGGDKYDGDSTYVVHVRVGGVLVVVTSDGDRDTGIALAARAAERVRAGLYGVAAGGTSG